MEAHLQDRQQVNWDSLQGPVPQSTGQLAPAQFTVSCISAGLRAHTPGTYGMCIHMCKHFHTQKHGVYTYIRAQTWCMSLYMQCHGIPMSFDASLWHTHAVHTQLTGHRPEQRINHKVGI